MASHPLFNQRDSAVISDLENALNRADYKIGPAYGVYGPATMRAIEACQIAKGLAQGDLTYETREALGIFLVW